MTISISKHYKLDTPKILISIFYFLAYFIYLYSFISREYYIYSFDFGIHYAEFIQVHDSLLLRGFLPTCQLVLDSIRNLDYNLLSVFILSPFSFLSTSRLSFLLAITLTYLLPSYWLFLKVISLFVAKASVLFHFIITSLFFLSPNLILPILRNQSSIGALIPILIIYYLFFHQLLKHTLNFKTIPLLALLIIFPPLLHRWYLPFSLSFLVIAPIFSYFVFPNRRQSLLYYLFLFLATIFIFLLISGNLWQKFFLVDYSKLYQYYHHGLDYFASLSFTFSQIGYPLTFLFLFSSFSLFRHSLLKYPSLFLFLNFSLSLALFLRIQNMGLHHYYLIIIPLIINISLWLSTLKLNLLPYPIVIFMLIFSNFFLSTLDKKPISFSETSTTLEIISDLQKLNPQLVYILSNEIWLNALSTKNYVCYFNQTYLSLCPHIAEVSYFASIDSFTPTFTGSDYFLLNSRALAQDSDPAIKNLGLFIIKHPQYYQIQKIYHPNHTNTITLYHLLKYPNPREFELLKESIINHSND